jgi:hypothetical protein
MRPRIRPFDDRDADAVVGLSLRAWAPAFASLEQVLGSEIFRRQHPDAGAKTSGGRWRRCAPRRRDGCGSPR